MKLCLSFWLINSCFESCSIFTSAAVFQRRWSPTLRFLTHSWNKFYARMLQILIREMFVLIWTRRLGISKWGFPWSPWIFLLFYVKIFSDFVVKITRWIFKFLYALSAVGATDGSQLGRKGIEAELDCNCGCRRVSTIWITISHFAQRKLK